MTKEFKNHVTASRFLAWYFSDSEDAESIGNRAIASLNWEGSFNISVRILFDECGYIPQHICEDADGDNEYDPSQVCFIQD
jgi:hypothetical protein